MKNFMVLFIFCKVNHSREYGQTDFSTKVTHNFLGLALLLVLSIFEPCAN